MKTCTINACSLCGPTFREFTGWICNVHRMLEVIPLNGSDIQVSVDLNASLKATETKKKQQNKTGSTSTDLTTSVSALAKTSTWRPAFRPTHFWLVWMWWVYEKRVLFSQMGSCPADLIFLWSIKSKHFISSNYYMALHIPTWVMCLTKRVCERGP